MKVILPLKGGVEMKKSKGDSGDLLDLMVEWQDIETGNILYAKEALPKAKNPLTKTMLKVIRLEAEKNSLIQQMIVESIRKEAVHLSPEDLGTLSGHLNRYIEAEEKVLSHAETAMEKHETFVPRSLLSFLVSDLKQQNCLLRQFDDELKNASIPTSATSKRF
jgi:hypothetical protein